MLETISAEIIYCRERARLAREKADTTATAEAKNDCLAAETRWLALARGYEQQDRLSKALGENERPASRSARERTYALDPEVVAIVSSAFHTVFAELDLSNSDDILALRVARRIVELVVRGERDPERLKAVVHAWAMRQTGHMASIPHKGIPDNASHVFSEALISLVQWKGDSEEPTVTLDGQPIGETRELLVAPRSEFQESKQQRCGDHRGDGEE
jgi:hypothetical protein